jgi:hypothetical protein
MHKYHVALHVVGLLAGQIYCGKRLLFKLKGVNFSNRAGTAKVPTYMGD